MASSVLTRKELAQFVFDRYFSGYDEDCGYYGITIGEEGYQGTRLKGRAHEIRENMYFAHLIFLSENKELYPVAKKILQDVLDAQNTDRSTPTFGLWPYFFEETLDDMKVIDYNWAEFISVPFIAIMKEHRDLISDEMAERIKTALRYASECCINRNVGLDYTNVIAMSSYTLTVVGEILEDERLFTIGKHELKRFWEYSMHCGTFNEFNSPCYALVTANAISKMLLHFEDEECIKMANDLNECLWRMIATSYSNTLKQFTPPYSRCYDDLQGDSEAEFIYISTQGKYGKLCSKATGTRYFSICNPNCPESLFPLFEANGWNEIVYYRKNNLRTPEEDLTIVQDIDSPDLIARSYKTDKYLFGAFKKSDLWVQRRALTAYWNKDSKRGFDVCSSKDGKPLSSTMIYVSHYENKGIAILGLTTDHGDFHYIVDPLKDGAIQAKKLSFKIRLMGNCEGLSFKKQGDAYVLTDNDVTVKFRVFDFIYNNEKAEVRITDDGLEFVCFEGDELREITLSDIKDTYAVLSFAIDDEAPNVSFELTEDKIKASSDNGDFYIETFRKPVPYNNCIRDTIVK